MKLTTVLQFSHILASPGGRTGAMSNVPSASRAEKLRYLEALAPSLKELIGLVGDAGWLQCGFRGHFWCQGGGFEANFGAKGVALRPCWCQSGLIDSLLH